MQIHTLKTVQTLGCSLDEAWDFISSPANLKMITPEYMGFEITSEFNREKMFSGMIVRYNVKPVFGLPIRWVTEITHVEEPYYFVDEQRFGPYKFWHHKHFLRETADGVEMTDVVHYALPFGPFGAMVHPILVRPKLEDIFRYRRKILAKIFPFEKATPVPA